MPRPLASVLVPMDQLRFARVQAAAAGKLGQPLTGTSGDITEHGGDIAWSYDGTVLRMDILREFHFGPIHYHAAKIQQELLAWVESIQ